MFKSDKTDTPVEFIFTLNNLYHLSDQNVDLY